MRSSNGFNCPNCRAPLISSQRRDADFDRMRIQIPEHLQSIANTHINNGRNLFPNTTVYMWDLGEEEHDFTPVIRNNEGDTDVAYLPDGSVLGRFSNIPTEEIEEVRYK